MPNKEFSKTGLFLGIDFGKTNIGLAIGRNGLVTPLEILPGKNIENSLNQINRTIIENKVDKIVVGLPLTADGKDTTESLEIRRFASARMLILFGQMMLVVLAGMILRRSWFALSLSDASVRKSCFGCCVLCESVSAVDQDWRSQFLPQLAEI